MRELTDETFEHEVRVLRRRRQAWHVRRVVREVAVHLENEVRAKLERTPEACEIGGAEAFLALPMQHVHVVVLGGQAIGDLPCSVGRVVVDHEHVQVVEVEPAKCRDHRLEVLALVVRGEADQVAHGPYHRRGG